MTSPLDKASQNLIAFLCWDHWSAPAFPVFNRENMTLTVINPFAAAFDAHQRLLGQTDKVRWLGRLIHARVLADWFAHLHEYRPDSSNHPAPTASVLLFTWEANRAAELNDMLAKATLQLTELVTAAEQYTVPWDEAEAVLTKDGMYHFLSIIQKRCDDVMATIRERTEARVAEAMVELSKTGLDDLKIPNSRDRGVGPLSQFLRSFSTFQPLVDEAAVQLNATVDTWTSPEEVMKQGRATTRELLLRLRDDKRTLSPDEEKAREESIRLLRDESIFRRPAATAGRRPRVNV